DLARERFAGLIFANHPFHLAHTALLQTPGVPRVAIMTGPPQGDYLTVNEDHAGFATRAVERLVARGRRRIAVIAGFAGRAAGIGGPGLDRALARHGLSVPRYWRLALHPFMPEAGRGVAHLLFNGTGGQRPDGVIVLDDHLIDVVLAGMMDAGLRTPDD